MQPESSHCGYVTLTGGGVLLLLLSLSGIWSESPDFASNNESDNDSDVLNNENEIPKIEFIVEKDENEEKQIRMNFEFTINNSSKIVKIDLEISKNTYLEIADELLK